MSENKTTTDRAAATGSGDTRRLALAGIFIAALLGALAFVVVQYLLAQPTLHRSGGTHEVASSTRPWQKVLEGPGHRAHLTGPNPVACADCHDIQSGSFKAPDASRCSKCHEGVVPTIHSNASAPPEARECTSCHNFLANESTSGAWNCIRCHAKAQGEFGAVVVHSKEACGGCHRPHQSPSLAPPPCTECHKDVQSHPASAMHGAAASAPVNNSNAPAGGAGTTATTFHAGAVASAAANALPAAEVPAGACLACHQPHEKAGVAASSCARCHQDPKIKAPHIPATAVVVGKHDTCIGCHKPHVFKKAEVASCQSCHSAKVTLGQFTAKPHGLCNSCHDPHNAKAAAGDSCQRCHANVHPDHKITDCKQCHNIHPTPGTLAAQAPRKAVACSSCHNKASSDVAFHLGNTECTACHKPHGFAKPGITACQACHKPQATLAASGGHNACAGCHTPHAPKTPTPACATCHADKGKLVNKGHQACAGCHQEKHAPKRNMTECKSCHKVEASTAPKGHQACAGCHEPHAGTPTVAKCASCHPDRATGPHRNIKDGCNNCHKAHGSGAPGGSATIAKPPACNTCHKPGSLPALHNKPHHADCASCHTSHGGPRGDRATCMKCHTDRANHEPTAAVCTGCHMFRGATK